MAKDEPTLEPSSRARVAGDNQWTLSTESGDGDELSDDRLTKLAQEVSELAATVAHYRLKGPVEYAALVEKSLSAFSELPTVESASTQVEVTEGQEYKFMEIIARRGSLTKRFEVATSLLPKLSKEMKECAGRLDNVISVLSEQIEA